MGSFSIWHFLIILAVIVLVAPTVVSIVATAREKTKSHQHRLMRDACKAARIAPAISFHVLRHCHGALLAMRGVPLPVIAKQLGHADTRITERHYAHLSPSYVADTIRANFPILGVVKADKVATIKTRTQ